MTEQFLGKLGLPMPELHDYLRATSGAIIFVNQYGFLIRIEKTYMGRVNDSPWVLQPFGSIELKLSGLYDSAIIEICPGVLPASKEKELKAVVKGAENCGGVDFGDHQVANIGILPFKTPTFPKGVPIVIDRPSVTRLVADVAHIKKALHYMRVDKDPQELLYADIKEAWKDAFGKGMDAADPVKIKTFLDLCLRAKEEGRTMSGWNIAPNGSSKGAFYKQHIAKAVAGRYSKKMQS